MIDKYEKTSVVSGPQSFPVNFLFKNAGNVDWYNTFLTPSLLLTMSDESVNNGDSPLFQQSGSEGDLPVTLLEGVIGGPFNLTDLWKEVQVVQDDGNQDAQAFQGIEDGQTQEQPPYTSTYYPSYNANIPHYDGLTTGDLLGVSSDTGGGLGTSDTNLGSLVEDPTQSESKPFYEAAANTEVANALDLEKEIAGLKTFSFTYDAVDESSALIGTDVPALLDRAFSFGTFTFTDTETPDTVNNAPIAQPNTYQIDALTTYSTLKNGYVVGNIIMDPGPLVDSDPDFSDSLSLDSINNATLTFAGNILTLTPVSHLNPDIFAKYEFNYQGNTGTLTIDTNGVMTLNEITSSIIQSIKDSNAFFDIGISSIIMDQEIIPATLIYSSNPFDLFDYDQYAFTYQGISGTFFVDPLVTFQNLTLGHTNIVDLQGNGSALFLALNDTENAVFSFDYTIKEESSGLTSNAASVNVVVSGNLVPPTAVDNSFTIQERQFDKYVPDPSDSFPIFYDFNGLFYLVYGDIYNAKNTGNYNKPGNVISDPTLTSGNDLDPQGNLLAPGTLSIHSITNPSLTIAGQVVPLTLVSNPSTPNAFVEYQFVTNPANTEFFLYNTNLNKLFLDTHDPQALTGTIAFLNNGDVVINGQIGFQDQGNGLVIPPHNIFLGLNVGESADFSFDYTVQNSLGLISNTAHIDVTIQGQNNTPFLDDIDTFSGKISNVNASIGSGNTYFLTNLFNTALDVDANDSLHINTFSLTTLSFIDLDLQTIFVPVTPVVSLPPDDVAAYQITYAGQTLILEIQKDGDVFFTSDTPDFFMPLLGRQAFFDETPAVFQYVLGPNAPERFVFDFTFNLEDSQGGLSSNGILPLSTDSTFRFILEGSYSRPIAREDSVVPTVPLLNPQDTITVTGNVFQNDFSQLPGTLKVIQITAGQNTYLVPQTASSSLELSLPVVQTTSGTNVEADFSIEANGDYTATFSPSALQSITGLIRVSYTLQDAIGTSTANLTVGYLVESQSV